MGNKTDSPFDPVFYKLDEMEQKQVVDASILADFTVLEKRLSEFEAECASSKDRETEDAFLLFHVMRSSRMIVEKVSLRFAEAKSQHENPVVVDLSRMVIPRLSDLYNLVSPILQDKKHILSLGERNAILRRLKIARDIASATAMLPSVEDEKKGVLKSDLRNRFQGLAESLQSCVDEK